MLIFVLVHFLVTLITAIGLVVMVGVSPFIIIPPVASLFLARLARQYYVHAYFLICFLLYVAVTLYLELNIPSMYNHYFKEPIELTLMQENSTRDDMFAGVLAIVTALFAIGIAMREIFMERSKQ